MNLKAHEKPKHYEELWEVIMACLILCLSKVEISRFTSFMVHSNLFRNVLYNAVLCWMALHCVVATFEPG